MAGQSISEYNTSVCTRDIVIIDVLEVSYQICSTSVNTTFHLLLVLHAILQAHAPL